MAKFLDTTGVSYHLQQLINNANERLVLISPFLKINERIKQSLEDKDRLKIDIRIIYGKNELQPEKNNWLKSLQSVRSSFCQNLHAKCYLNEKEAIITSMNLYDFSQVNNNEMGIYISKEDNPNLYSDVFDETMRLIRISDEIKISVEKIPPEKNDNDISEANAFCIRCKKSVEFKQSQPYCIDCFKEWNRYKNKNYKESHCHVCGNENESTMTKPICYNCFKSQDKVKNKLSNSQTDKGFCIRCKKEVEIDNLHPYCIDCFKVWSKFKNKKYKEKYCHVCGKENESTSIKPICYSCYKTIKAG
ncbi:MAG: hypothetical protein D3905_12785 [Candidatus Electrothrix sp. AS4_5]|nr:hypothetical protein [Candidatus Electrothrix gigas]